MAPSGGGELGAGVGATFFGLLVEGSRCLCLLAVLLVRPQDRDAVG